MSYNTIDQIRATATTTNGTQTTVGTYTLPTNCSSYVDAIIQGRNTSTGDMIAMRLGGMAKRLTGNSSQVGSIGNILATQSDLALILASATIDVSGTDIRIRVTGLAATSIEWMVVLNLYIN